MKVPLSQTNGALIWFQIVNMDPHIFGNFGGPPGWGGGGQPSSDTIFGFNPFARQDAEREQRKYRIAPHLEVIK